MSPFISAILAREMAKNRGVPDESLNEFLVTGYALGSATSPLLGAIVSANWRSAKQVKRRRRRRKPRPRQATAINRRRAIRTPTAINRFLVSRAFR